MMSACICFLLLSCLPPVLLRLCLPNCAPVCPAFLLSAFLQQHQDIISPLFYILSQYPLFWTGILKNPCTWFSKFQLLLRSPKPPDWMQKAEDTEFTRRYISIFFSVLCIYSGLSMYYYFVFVILHVCVSVVNIVNLSDCMFLWVYFCQIYNSIMRN